MKLCLEGAKDRPVIASEANPNPSSAVSKNLPLKDDFVLIEDLKKNPLQIVPKHSLVKILVCWQKISFSA